jgi:hypothetical protein
MWDMCDDDVAKKAADNNDKFVILYLNFSASIKQIHNV